MSILADCRRLVHIADPEDTFFDDELIIYINSVFTQLYRMGVGPATPFAIKGDTENWEDFHPDPRLYSVRTFVGEKVRLHFDPPSSSTVTDAIKQIVDEAEFTLRVNMRDIRKEEQNAGSGT